MEVKDKGEEGQGEEVTWGGGGGRREGLWSEGRGGKWTMIIMSINEEN